jgi:heat shock protein HtpX
MGAMIAGNPLWLASALKKISVMAKKVPNGRAEMFPAAAHVFIVNPLSGRGVDNMFSTHPNPENRIAELEALAREMGITGDGDLGDLIEQRPPASDDGDVWIAGRRYNQKSRGGSGPWTS